MVICSGAIDRWLTTSLVPAAKGEQQLSLSSFPHQIGHWKGSDIDLSQQVIEAAGSDDSVNRLYQNDDVSQWAFIYIAYWADRRLMTGHSPEICYTATGWTHNDSCQLKITTSAGKIIPCTIHRFRKPDASGQETIVLDFYLLNGLVSREQESYYGLKWSRRVKQNMNSKYAVHIQISSTLESSVREAAQQLGDIILSYLPDENGTVSAIEHASEANSYANSTDN